jgi:hypothetical protein
MKQNFVRRKSAQSGAGARAKPACPGALPQRLARTYSCQNVAVALQVHYE